MTNPIIFFNSDRMYQKLFICPTCGKVRQMPNVDLASINLSECDFDFVKTKATIEIDIDTIVEIDTAHDNVCHPICKSCNNQSMSICDPDTIGLAQILTMLGARDVEIVAGRTKYMSRFYNDSFYRITFGLHINDVANSMIYRAIIEGTLNEDVNFNIFDDFGMQGVGYYIEISPSDVSGCNRDSFIKFCNIFKDRLIRYLSN